jgi:aromatic ring hydroxylase
MAERLERLKMLRVAAVAMRSEFGGPDGPPGDFPAGQAVRVSQEHRP